MLVFFDSEFSDLEIDPKLISIGCVSEDDPKRVFYAEIEDTYEAKDCSDFTRETVLPLLEGGPVLMPLHEVALKIGNWIEEFSCPVELATDSAPWDWPWIQKLFHEPGTWPANLARQPVHLPTNYPAFLQGVDLAFKEGLRRHHALDDAMANRRGFLAVRDWWEANIDVYP